MAEEAAPATPASAPLSVSEAVSFLAANPPPVIEEEAPAEATPESEAAPTAEDTDAPAEEPVSDGEPEEAVEPPEDAPQAVIDPPANWDADAKTKWSELPRELQEYLSGLETQRNTAVSTAQREAAEVRKAADADLAQVKTLSEELSQFLPQALKTFQSRWGDAPDWTKIAEEYGADEAFKLKVQYEQEQQQLGELIRKESQAKELAHREFRKEQFATLQKIAPEMADPKTGPDLQRDVMRWAVETGVATPADLPYVSAQQLAMAHKAMQWDKLQESLKSQPKPKPAPAPAATRRPTAALPQRGAESRNVETLTRRLAQTGKVDDAVALLRARRG